MGAERTAGRFPPRSSVEEQYFVVRDHNAQ